MKTAPAATRVYDAQPPVPNTARTGFDAAAVAPPLALGLVGLTPEQRDADHNQDEGPEGSAARTAG